MSFLQMRLVPCLLLLAIQETSAFRIKSNADSLMAEGSADPISDCTAALQRVAARLQVKEVFGAAMDWSYGWWAPGKSSSYKKQWEEAASKVEVVRDSRINKTATWADMMPDGAAYYAYERERMKMIGRISEKSGFLVEKNSVRGICDLSLVSLKFLTHYKVVLERLWVDLPDTDCPNTSLPELAASMRHAVENECFNECSEAVDTLIENFTCSYIFESFKENGTASGDFFERAMNASEQCAHTPYDTLEAITDLAARRKCQNFYPPTLLWQENDKAPGEMTQEKFGGVLMIVGGIGFKAIVGDVGGVILSNAAKGLGDAVGSVIGKLESDHQEIPSRAVCSLPKQHATSRDKEHIVQNGTCPEGSKCKCPMTRIKSRQTAKEIRSGGAVYVKGGIASVPSLLTQTAIGLIPSIAAVGIVSSLSAPLFLIAGATKLSLQALAGYFSFECRDTLGCWPQDPDSVSVNGTQSACRLPEKAKEGGSPLWFVPPPGLRIHHSKGWCVLDNCKIDDYLTQTVGLGRSANDDGKYSGKPNVYNCQPLSFEAMSPAQRKLFIERLEATGIKEEYSLSDARAAIDSELGHEN